MNTYKNKNVLDTANQSMLQTLLIRACNDGDIETIRYIYGKNKFQRNSFFSLGKKIFNNLTQKLNVSRIPSINFSNQSLLVNACYGGHIELVRYMIDSNELVDNIQIEKTNGNCVFEAAKMGHLEIVKYLMEEKNILRQVKEIHDRDYDLSTKKKINIFNKAIESANMNGHREVVKYLLEILSPHLEIDSFVKKLFLDATAHRDMVAFYLTEPKYKDIINLHDYTTEQKIIEKVCKNDSAEVIKFLTTSELLEKKLTIDKDDDVLLINLCKNKKYAILEYLIMEYDMKKTERLKIHLPSYPEVERMFNIRDLNNKLIEELPVNSTPSSKKRKKI